ncbi:unnamed protein product [Lathyrus oleraceus]|nr:uncharacterized protein LOC127128303 [Pisum sativum]
MAGKELASSSFPSNFNPPNSNNDSSENNSSTFPTHPSNHFSRMGDNNEFMVSTTPINTNKNDTLVMPQPSSDRYMNLPQDPSEDLIKSSSRKRTDRHLGSKNRPKAHIIAEEDTQTFTELVVELLVERLLLLVLFSLMLLLLGKL